MGPYRSVTSQPWVCITDEMDCQGHYLESFTTMLNNRDTSSFVSLLRTTWKIQMPVTEWYISRERDYWHKDAEFEMKVRRRNRFRTRVVSRSLMEEWPDILEPWNPTDEYNMDWTRCSPCYSRTFKMCRKHEPRPLISVQTTPLLTYYKSCKLNTNLYTRTMSKKLIVRKKMDLILGWNQIRN